MADAEEHASNSTAPTRIPRKRTHAFLEKLAMTTKVSKTKTSLELVRKTNERRRLLAKRRKQEERMKKMTKDLETTEAQLEIVNSDIQKLKALEEEGSEDEN